MYCAMTFYYCLRLSLLKEYKFEVDPHIVSHGLYNTTMYIYSALELS